MSNHEHTHGQQTLDERYGQKTWDDRYSEADRIWSGQPNQRLVEQVTGLTPGTALDVGAGEGADSVWLAEHGWSVTAIDVSPVALAKTRAHAAEAGVEITTLQHDLISHEPLPGTFDLVTAHFWHPPLDRFADFRDVLGAAVVPGGTLLVVAHHPDDLVGRDDPNGHGAYLFRPEKLAELFSPTDWDIQVCAAQQRPTNHHHAGPEILTDTVFRAVRR